MWLIVSCVLSLLALQTVHGDKEILACFENTPDHGIAGTFNPIAEMYGVTVYECLQFCIRSNGNSVGRLCQSVIYHKHEWSCSVYVETGLGNDGFRVPAYGHDHYLRTEFEGTVCASPTDGKFVLPVQATCEPTDFPVYLLYLGESIISGPTDVVKTFFSTATECANGCTRNSVLARIAKEDNDVPVACAGIVYTPSTQTCVYHSEDAEPLGPNKLLPTTSSVYSQKFCMPLDIEEICKPEIPLFSVYNNRQPVGNPIQNIQIDTPVNCLASCARRPDCQSVTWTVNESEVNMKTCALWPNKVNNASDGVVTSFDKKVLYIEEGCKEILIETPYQCKTGQLPAYFVIPGHSGIFGTSAGKRIENASPVQCANLCSQNVDKERGSDQPCGSTTYNSKERLCVIHAIKAAPSGPGRLVPDPEVIYTEKFCLPPSLSASNDNCVNNVFFVDLDIRVSGLNSFQAVPALSMEECIQACILEGDCRTASFTPSVSVTNNCELFEESPNGDQLTPTANYFVISNGCRVGGRNRRRELKSAVLNTVEERKVVKDQVQRLILEVDGDEIQFLPVFESASTTTHEPITQPRLTTDSIAAITSPLAKASRNPIKLTKAPQLSEYEDDEGSFESESIDESESLSLLNEQAPWSEWTPCQFVIDGERVRARSRQCSIFDCPPGSLQVQRCVA